MIKAKIHAVHIGGHTHLIWALTKEGAVRDVCAYLVNKLRATAHVDLATGEQIYDAGVERQGILGEGEFKRTVDPDQLPLAGIELTGP